LAFLSRFVVDPSGVARNVHIDPDYTARAIGYVEAGQITGVFGYNLVGHRYSLSLAVSRGGGLYLKIHRHLRLEIAQVLFIHLYSNATQNNVWTFLIS
jgi:hypothetical protein